MKIKPFKTSDVNSLHLNILLYGHGGAGKTTAIGRFADTFGKGLIISGEGGLSSMSSNRIKFNELKEGISIGRVKNIW